MHRFALIACLVLVVFVPEAKAIYSIDDLDEAKLAADKRHVPMAWLRGKSDFLALAYVSPGDPAELTQLAVRELEKQSIVIFVNPGAEVGRAPAIVSGEFDHMNDRSQPNLTDYLKPKIVFSTPDCTRVLGHVTFADLRVGREDSIASALQIIHNDPGAQFAIICPPAPLQPPPPGPPKPPPVTSSQFLRLLEVFKPYIPVWMTLAIVICLSVLGLIVFGLYALRPRAPVETAAPLATTAPSEDHAA